MNSIVGPIFIESFAEKKMFMDSVNSVQDPLKSLKSARMRSQKKRKKEKKKKRWNAYAIGFHLSKHILKWKWGPYIER